MDYLNVVLSGLGSIASIVGLCYAFTRKESIRNKWLFALIILLTAFTSVISYDYTQEINEKLETKIRKEEVRIQAKKMVASFGYVNHYEPGVSEGLMLSTLRLLEGNRDLYPDSYSQYREHYVNKIKKANEADEYDKRKLMEEVGQAALQILKDLSN